MQDSAFDYEVQVDGGEKVFLKVTFQLDRYIVAEPTSGWHAHFDESGPLLISHEEPSLFSGVELEKILSSPVDQGLWHKWSVWRTQQER